MVVGTPGHGADPDRPAPGGAATAAEFVTAMVRLKNWSGLSYRRLERRAESAGDVLPRTTLTNALSTDRLPQEDLLAAFTRACGCGPAETQEWIRVRRRIAGAAPALPGAAPVLPAAEPPPPVYVPVLLGRPRRSVLAAFAAATAIGTAAGALVVGVLKSSVNEPARAGWDRAAAPPITQGPSASPTPHPGADAVAKAPPPTRAQLRNPPAARPGVPVTLYVGDSIGVETGNLVEYFVHLTGKARVVPAVKPGLTLCNLVKEADLSRRIARTRPRVIALQLWGRPSGRQGCAGGLDDARRTIRQITQLAGRAGIPRPKLVWVLQGPDKTAPDRIRALNQDVYQRVADDHPGDTTADAGAMVSMEVSYTPEAGSRYQWADVLPCYNLERSRPPYCSMPKAYGGVTRVRPESDPVHLCLEVIPDHRCFVISPGAVRYSRVIAQTMLTELP